MHLPRRVTIAGAAAILAAATFGATIPVTFASTPSQTGCGGTFTLAPRHSIECSFAAASPATGIGIGAFVGRGTGVAVVRLQTRGPAGVPHVLLACAAATARWGGGCGSGEASSGPVVAAGTTLVCVISDATAAPVSGVYGCDSSS
jgi:hypothetical protein